MHSFRFIHASDFHLETPPHGLAEAPDALREILLEAPHRAANNVFEAALAREVDFVILAGDIVAPQAAGPRALVFLRDQFARLAERGIQVYWAGGEVDHVANWPAVLAWPSNVHFFPADRIERFVHRRHELAICELIGQSRPPKDSVRVNQFTPSVPSLFPIAVAHGDTDEVDLAASGIRYWALGGEHEPTLPVETSPLAHYPGTPQGRSPQESGPHGCTLVDVSFDGTIRPAPIVTDVVRFAHENVKVPSHASIAEIESAVRARLDPLAASADHITWLVAIDVERAEPARRQPDIRGWTSTALATLRGEFGYRSLPVWVTDLRILPREVPRHWRDQENLLGDYLRTIAAARESAAPLNFDRFLPTGDQRAQLLRLLTSDEAGRQAALDEAAQLGALLLTPEETRV
jgi:hypothetical protein